MDAFEKLGLGLRLRISDEGIREAFRKSAARSHPDSGGNEADFAALQAAQETLLSPARRVKEWLRVKGIEVDVRGQIEGRLMDLFQEVAQVGSEAESEIKANHAAGSALAKAMSEVKLMTRRERVKALLTKIEAEISERTDEFEKVENGEADAGKMVRDLVFLEKWRGTLKGVYGRLM